MAKKFETDYDADYKLPKILKNYKGNEICQVRIQGFDESKIEASTNQRNASKEISLSPSRAEIEPSRSISTNPPPPPLSFDIISNSIAREKAFFTINHEWNQKWKSVLLPDVNIVHTSFISKRNVMGIPIKRQLILTDLPSLFYVDISNNSIKGSIPWNKTSPPKAIMVDKSTFTVDVPDRTFKFTDSEHNASLWVQRINATGHYFKST